MQARRLGDLDGLPEDVNVLGDGPREARDHAPLDLAGDLLDRREIVRAAGKPASMMSTFSRSSCLANSSFCSDVSEKPGDCSPSRNVVSKIRTCATANSQDP